MYFIFCTKKLDTRNTNSKKVVSKPVSGNQKVYELKIKMRVVSVVGKVPLFGVDESESPEGLRQGRNDWSVSLRVVIEFEQRRCHQLVVLGHREVSLFLELHQEQFPVLFGLGDVGRDVGVLGRLEIWPPPVSCYHGGD